MYILNLKSLIKHRIRHFNIVYILLLIKLMFVDIIMIECLINITAIGSKKQLNNLVRKHWFSSIKRNKERKIRSNEMNKEMIRKKRNREVNYKEKIAWYSTRNSSRYRKLLQVYMHSCTYCTNTHTHITHTYTIWGHIIFSKWGHVCRVFTLEIVLLIRTQFGHTHKPWS